MKNSPRAPLGYRFKVTGRSRKCGSRMTCALVTRPCGKSILSKLETGTFRPSMVRYCLAFGYFGLRRVPGLFTLAKTLFEIVLSRSRSSEACPRAPAGKLQTDHRG